MESTLSQKFFKSIRWNAIEAIPYHILLSLHNVILFNVVGSATYGLIGTLFSAVFLLVGITNLGFDASLSTFFLDAQKNKVSFRSIIGAHILPTLIGLCLAILIVFFMIDTMSLPLFVLTIMLIFIEGLKKIIRALLHGAFYNKQTALVELFQIVTYILYVWIPYTRGCNLTVTFMYAGLVVISTICTAMLGYQLYLFYDQLSDHHQGLQQRNIDQRIIRQRVSTALIGFNRHLFSGNSLILLFAYTFGITYAGTLKIISSLLYSILICVQKIFGPTTDALLAHVKYGKLHEKQAVFFLVTKHTYEILYALLASGIFISFLVYASASETCVNDMSLSILIFFIVHISELFFNSYEHFFIAENCAFPFMLGSGIMIGCLYASIYFAIVQTPLTFLIIITGVRVFSFFVLGRIAYHWWNISPSTYINPVYVICSLIISFLCFLIIR